jgi:hypothetical protein
MTNRVFGLENSGRSLLTFHCKKAHVHHRARQTGQFPVQTNNELTPPARFVAVPCPCAREPCVPPLHRVSFFRQPLYISLSAGVIHSPFRRKPRRVRGRTPSSSSLSSWCQNSRLPSASDRFKTIQVPEGRHACPKQHLSCRTCGGGVIVRVRCRRPRRSPSSRGTTTKIICSIGR